MRFNTRGCYALRLMTDITRHGGASEPVPLRDVARRQHISRLYLSQLAVPLRHAALLKSVWGNKGGFVLGRPPGEIRALDVVEAIDGPIGVLNCVQDPNVCARSPHCECLCIWRAINEGIVKTLSGYTLADLASRGSSLIDDPGGRHEPSGTCCGTA